MPKFAPYTLSVIVLAALLQACSTEPSAEDAASNMVAAINAGDAIQLWEFVSFESRSALSEQLMNNKTTASGQQLLKSALGLEDSEIEALSLEDYFVLIMEADPNFGVRQVELVGVDVTGDTAKIYYKGGGIEGVSSLVKEQGQWKFVAELP